MIIHLKLVLPQTSVFCNFEILECQCYSAFSTFHKAKNIKLRKKPKIIPYFWHFHYFLQQIAILSKPALHYSMCVHKAKEIKFVRTTYLRYLPTVALLLILVAESA